MFDVAIWGTVASWTGSLLTGLSVLFGVGYYVFDRRRERRAQAGSVVVWLHPHEHGPPFIKMLNLSDKPVFDLRLCHRIQVQAPDSQEAVVFSALALALGVVAIVQAAMLHTKGRRTPLGTLPDWLAALGASPRRCVRRRLNSVALGVWSAACLCITWSNEKRGPCTGPTSLRAHPSGAGLRTRIAPRIDPWLYRATGGHYPWILGAMARPR